MNAKLILARIFAVLFVLLMIFACSQVLAVGASGGISALVPHQNVRYHVGGGDCSADNASADLHTPQDPYCRSVYGNSARPVSFMETMEPAPEILPTATLKVWQKPERNEDENPPVISTPEPTQEPAPEVTQQPDPEPTQEPEPEPDETCRPNSGGGNDSEDCDDDGEDDDPGNSEGHNHGGD